MRLPVLPASAFVVIGCLAVRSISEAATIPIVNPSFEDPVIADGLATPDAPPGWPGPPTGYCLNPTLTQLPGGAPEGQNVLVVEGFDSFFVGQEVGTLAEGMYTLSYDVGTLVGLPAVGYQVQLLAGTTAIATDDNSLWPIAAGEFKPGSLSVTIAAADSLIGQPLQLRFLSQAGSSSDFTYISYDDVRLELSPIPEPPTFGLGILAAACAWTWVTLSRHLQV